MGGRAGVRDAGTGLHRPTHVKAHRCAGGGKGGLLLRPSVALKADETPRSYALSDEQCRPLAFYLTPGQTADIKGAVMLAGHLPRARYLLADKAYDADHWRGWSRLNG